VLAGAIALADKALIGTMEKIIVIANKILSILLGYRVILTSFLSNIIPEKAPLTLYCLFCVSGYHYFCANAFPLYCYINPSQDPTISENPGIT